MHSLERQLDALWPTEKWQNTRVLVAVSGGADSVALLRAIVNLAGTQSGADEGRVHAAHYNHGWRGAESDGDEEFVRKLCQQMQIPLSVGWCSRHCDEAPHHARADDAGQPSSGDKLCGVPDIPLPKLPRKSEAGARELRYNFLSRAAYQCGARFVLTAHTASDRVETLLHNLFRGTGLAGVVGPPLTRPLDAELVLVRPLLGCWREQVEAYLQELGQAFRQDASNTDTIFQRNYLRHNLLPELRGRFGEKLDERLLGFSKLAEGVVADQRELAAEYLRQVALMHEATVAGIEVARQDGLYLPSLKRLPCSWNVVHQAMVRSWHERDWPLQSMSRDQWNGLRRLMTNAATGDRENLPGSLVAERSGEWVVIGKTESARKQKSDKPLGG